MSSSCAHKHRHGSSRSLVRMIGNSIPIDTGHRLHIQLPMFPESPQPDSRRREEGLMVVGSLGNPDSVSSQKTGGLFTIREVEEMEGEGFDSVFDDSGMETIPEGEEEEDNEDGAQGQQKQEALDKISALESELSRLKAQIAVYALSEESHAPAAPPPPPVLPPIPSTTTPALSKTAQQAVAGGGGAEAGGTGSRPPVPPTPTPSMSHVLRDIGSVKLRSVPAMVRSPGGTPLRRVQESREAASNDPGAIIAQALRKKFSHKVFQDSPDKENLDRSADVSLSGFESPAGKLFN